MRCSSCSGEEAPDAVEMLFAEPFSVRSMEKRTRLRGDSGCASSSDRLMLQSDFTVGRHMVVCMVVAEKRRQRESLGGEIVGRRIVHIARKKFEEQRRRLILSDPSMTQFNRVTFLVETGKDFRMPRLNTAFTDRKKEHSSVIPVAFVY